MYKFKIIICVATSLLLVSRLVGSLKLAFGKEQLIKERKQILAFSTFLFKQPTNQRFSSSHTS